MEDLRIAGRGPTFRSELRQHNFLVAHISDRAGNRLRVPAADSRLPRTRTAERSRTRKSQAGADRLRFCYWPRPRAVSGIGNVASDGAAELQHQFPVIAIVGVLRPRLFIAEQVLTSLEQNELLAAIEHEAGHVVANDNLRRGLMRACRDVLVMIPGGRLLDRAWVEASEAAADEYAAGRGRGVALDLASALIKIARLIPAGMKPAMPAGAFLLSTQEEANGVKARVRRLMQLADRQGTRQGRPLISRMLLWTPIAVTILVAALAANEPHVLASIHLLIEESVRLLS